MGNIIKVKVSHYIFVETDEMDDELAFNSAEEKARIFAQKNGLEYIEIESMEITECVLPLGYEEDTAYEERRCAELFSA